MNRVLTACLLPAAALLGGVASAAPLSVPGLAPLPEHLPPRCEPLARVPASATIPGPQLAAHVSVANCLAEDAMNELRLSPDAASIDRLDAAVAPSLALLDGVIVAGDAYWKVIAEDAKRDLYVGMIVRERASIPSGDRVAHDALEPKLAPWQEDTSQAIAAIARLTREDPALSGRDPVIARAAGHGTDERTRRVAHRGS